MDVVLEFYHGDLCATGPVIRAEIVTSAQEAAKAAQEMANYNWPFSWGVASLEYLRATAQKDRVPYPEAPELLSIGRAVETALINAGRPKAAGEGCVLIKGARR